MVRILANRLLELKKDPAVWKNIEKHQVSLVEMIGLVRVEGWCSRGRRDRRGSRSIGVGGVNGDRRSHRDSG